MHIPTLLAILPWLPIVFSKTIWTLNNFTLALTPTNTTSLSFTFTDPSPAFPTVVLCTSNTTATTQACGPNRDVLFRVSKDLGEVVLRRRMSVNSTSTGMATQATNWVHGVNVTETAAGKTYVRSEDWDFTVTSVSG